MSMELMEIKESTLTVTELQNKKQRKFSRKKA